MLCGLLAFHLKITTDGQFFFSLSLHFLSGVISARRTKQGEQRLRDSKKFDEAAFCVLRGIGRRAERILLLFCRSRGTCMHACVCVR